MENKAKIVRRHYGMPVYGVTYDDGREGGYLELPAGTVPTFDIVLSAILGREWPPERRLNLSDMQRYRPEDVDTVKLTNAYSFEFGIAVDAAKAVMAAFNQPEG